MAFPKSATPKIGRPAKQELFYAVTFESETNAPLTITGSIVASNPARSAYLATKAARLRAKGIRWSSLVVLVSKEGPVGPATARASER